MGISITTHEITCDERHVQTWIDFAIIIVVVPTDEAEYMHGECKKRTILGIVWYSSDDAKQDWKSFQSLPSFVC
jgi:hypothetical protein